MSTNFKSIKADKTTETRDNHSLEQQGTGNLFETIVVLSSRSNQLAVEMKQELNWLEEFITTVILKKCSKTESKLKSLVSMSGCRSHAASPSQSSDKTSSASTIRWRGKKPEAADADACRQAESSSRHVAQ